MRFRPMRPFSGAPVPLPVIFRRRQPGASRFRIETDFRVLFEDEHLLVIDKPAPLAMHPVGSYAKLNLHTLLCSDPRWAGLKLRLTHRLDSETSGVTVVAKSYEAARAVGIEFLSGRVRKVYRALVFGRPEPAAGEVHIPLGFDKSSGFQTVRVPDAERGEAASTRYRVTDSAGGYSWVDVEPLTGRTHQIRAHLACLGHPIVGDKIYIDPGIFRCYVAAGLDERMLERLKLDRLALHARSIELAHPRTGETVRFESPCPDFLSKARI